MYNEMTNKELKEMMNYFAVVEANHRNAGRMESAYEANEKKGNCRHELARRAAK
jgi:hypothetical protein